MSNKVTSRFEALLPGALLENGYDLLPSVQQQLVQYLHLLQRWNSVFNLTAIRDPREMVWLHILDSLSIGSYLHGSRIIDVGTGAGLPGIPLALVYPDKHFTLLDSNGKKTRFLTQTVYELGIKNIEVVHERCENFSPARGFDSIVSRAFSSIAVMLASTQQFLAPKGQFLAMKGVFPKEEILEIPPDFTVVGVYNLVIKGLAAERHLVCIEKKS